MSMSEMDTQDFVRQRRREIDRRSYAKNREKRLKSGKEWRAANPDKVREIKRRWAANNPDKVREHRKRSPKRSYSIEAKRIIHRRNRYGVTPEAYDAMLVKQAGACKVCGKKPKQNKVLVVDHCHETEKIRGLLCTPCNVAIGNLGDNEAGLLRALNYIRDARPRP
jgi:hypothetical protein